MRMMNMNDESIYWLKNKSWYRINKEKDCFEINPDAPARAKISYEIWSGKRTPKKAEFTIFDRLAKHIKRA